MTKYINLFDLKISKIYKYSAFLLIFTFSVISGSEFLHNHTDSEDDHCPVCMIMHSLSGVDFNIITLNIFPLSVDILPIFSNYSIPDIEYSLQLSDRAPPVNS